MAIRFRGVLILLCVVFGRPLAAASADPPESRSPSQTVRILSVTNVVLNGLDVYTTDVALRSGGGREANPLVAPIAGNVAAFGALKAVTTTSTIYAARRLWKQHPAGAITLLLVANIATGIVVAHNARVAGLF